MQKLSHPGLQYIVGATRVNEDGDSQFMNFSSNSESSRGGWAKEGNLGKVKMLIGVGYRGRGFWVVNVRSRIYRISGWICGNVRFKRFIGE